MDHKPQSLLYQRAYVIGFWLGRVVGGFFVQVWANLKKPHTYIVVLFILVFVGYYYLVFGLLPHLEWK